MAVSRKTVWRKRQIILPVELVERLFEWHGGQHSSLYALASSGMRDLVSLSMIDAAIPDLESDHRLAKGKQKKELSHALSSLTELRQFWKEHSAKEAGMGLSESEYEYDHKNYGYSTSEEDEIPTTSG